jgi:hypothetical protein
MLRNQGIKSGVVAMFTLTKVNTQSSASFTASLFSQIHASSKSLSPQHSPALISPDLAFRCWPSASLVSPDSANFLQPGVSPVRICFAYISQHSDAVKMHVKGTFSGYKLIMRNGLCCSMQAGVPVATYATKFHLRESVVDMELAEIKPPFEPHGEDQQ